MDNSGWSRAYLVVAVLALFLIPVGGVVARITTGSTLYVTRQMGIDELPSSTAFCIKLGSTGYAVISGGALAIIGGMALGRRGAMGAVVSAAVFAVCLCFFLFAAASSHFPFWCIMWRLT
jgi:hypothetical protein